MNPRTLGSGPIVWLCIIVITCLLLVVFQTILWLVLPIMLAIVAYYLLSPLVNLAMARGVGRARAVLIITGLLCIAILLLGLTVAPKISATAHDFPNKLSEYASTGNALLLRARETLRTEVPYLFPKPAPSTAPHSSLGFVSSDSLPTVVTPAAPRDDVEAKVANLQSKYSGDIAVELLHWIPSLLLVPYFTYFFLLDGPRFKRFLVQAIPNAFFEKTLYLFYRVEDQLRSYFRGLLALTMLDGLCLGIGLWILGLNAPFLLAGLAAVMAWLPYLGSIGGCLLVVLVAAHDFPGRPWLPYEVAGLFVAVRLLDDFVFLPLTVGRSLHMHPLVTVLMILLAGAVAGIGGLLLVMPVLGVVMVAGQVIGELITDERILARHRHAQHLKRKRARTDLLTE